MEVVGFESCSHSARFVIKCVRVSGYQHLKEVECLLVKHENEFCVFFENLTRYTASWYMGYTVSQFVEALRFKLEGPDFDSQWGN